MPETKRNPPPPVIFTHTGLRGIAAMAVLLAHLNAYSIAGVFDQDIYVALFYWHSFAVDLFFVLSGFILHWVYVDRGPPPGLRASPRSTT
jgi:peptidoglycan/LPS O-acetylase OafA/YrhL